MKVNSYQESFYQRIADFGRDRPWVQFFGIACLALAIIAITNITSLFIDFNASVIQFSLSSSSLLLLLFTGLFLHFNGYRRVWGISFLVYATNFIGLSMGFSSTDINDPIIFHFWFLPLVFFVAGIWIATSNLFSEEKRIVYLPAFLILVMGESWFIFSLLILRNVELAIIGFSYVMFIPLLISLAYIWYRFGKKTDFNSPWLLAVGFLLMGLTHVIWNPWLIEVPGQLYYIFFTVYNISLLVIVGGFITLSKDLFMKIDIVQ
ncbi:MAG: hypothetical protein ACXAEU_19665 [Candidatus Hodarchaeales archaeon]|jgi:hypothetical protein